MKKLTLLLALTMILLSCENEESLEFEKINFFNYDLTETNIIIINNPVDVELIDYIDVLIYSDLGRPETKIYNTRVDANNKIEYFNNRIVITLAEGGFFDNEHFDNTNQIRGYVEINRY